MRLRAADPLILARRGARTRGALCCSAADLGIPFETRQSSSSFVTGNQRRFIDYRARTPPTLRLLQLVAPRSVSPRSMFWSRGRLPLPSPHRTAASFSKEHSAAESRGRLQPRTRPRARKESISQRCRQSTALKIRGNHRGRFLPGVLSRSRIHHCCSRCWDLCRSSIPQSRVRLRGLSLRPSPSRWTLTRWRR